MQLSKLSTPARVLVFVAVALVIAALCGLVAGGIGTFIDVMGWMPNFRNHTGQMLGLLGVTLGVALGATVIQYMGQPAERD
jgi:hypothetical protein